MKDKRTKREEAEARQAAYKADPSTFGLRRKVKDGLLTVEEAKRQACIHSPEFHAWLQRRVQVIVRGRALLPGGDRAELDAAAPPKRRGKQKRRGRKRGKR